MIVKMVDMHSHILPNVDDGAKSIDETYNLIEEAKNAGFSQIVLTPHYIEGYYEKNSRECKELMDKISCEVEGIKLYIGNEVYLSENLMEFLKNNKISSINNTKYILFEMPMNSKPMYVFEVVYEMLQQRKVPILAHPERYSFVFKEPELIYELIQKGVLMQANYGSIIGLYGTKSEIFVKKLLKNNMIHFLGSDVHKQGTVYKSIPRTIEVLNKLIGIEKVKELSEINPMKVLTNEKIDVEEPDEIKYTFIEKLYLNKR